MSTTRHADRAGLAPWLGWGAAAAAAASAGAAGFTAAQGRVSPATGAGAGVVVALLLVLGLPSVSIRVASRVVLAVSAAVLIRYGALAGTLADTGQVLLLWLVGAAGVLVLTDRIGTDAGRALAPPWPEGTVRAVGPDAVAPDGAGGRGPLATGRLVLAVAAMVGLAVLLLAPLVAPQLDRPTEAGAGPSLDRSSGGAAALRSSDALDMTTRPELGDGVVFTVDADRATFWRGQIFDTWDGRTWRRSDGAVRPLVDGDQVVPAEDDLGAGGSDEVVQRFRLEASYTDLVFAAASPATVDVPGPVAQRPDGTLLTRPMGQGAAYTVVSRRLPLSEGALRAAEGGTTPPELLERYAASTVVSDRVAAVAAQVTEGLTNDYDRIRALEAWMGSQTEYSLDAPLAPAGVDVVDDFLFESRLGWCEQIASSLVVLARAEGIPARLVTGYVPGERDPLTGEFTVRERDAHAWAEVWFPELGWVPFDPTADVGLAGSDAPEETLLEWLADHAVYLVAGVVALVLVAGPLRAVLLRRWRARRARRAAGAGAERRLDWAVGADRGLDRLGARAGRARSPDETAEAYGAALAVRYGDDRLQEVGRAVDDAVFAPDALAAEREAAAEAVLAELADADPLVAAPGS